MIIPQKQKGEQYIELSINEMDLRFMKEAEVTNVKVII